MEPLATSFGLRSQAEYWNTMGAVSQWSLGTPDLSRRWKVFGRQRVTLVGFYVEERQEQICLCQALTGPRCSAYLKAEIRDRSSDHCIAPVRSRDCLIWAVLKEMKREHRFWETFNRSNLNKTQDLIEWERDNIKRRGESRTALSSRIVW